MQPNLSAARSVGPNLVAALICGAVLTIGLPEPGARPAPPAGPPPHPCTNAIACENTLPGNPASEWDVAGAGSSAIQGFATSISVNRGQTIRFKVDTPATAYRLDIYRLGYYAGNGARKVATIAPSATLPQVQPACAADEPTGLTDCGTWNESASWAVPASAVSGVYIARLVRTDGTPGASHVVFVVRDDSGNSDLLMQTSDTTWQAYNDYGGSSLVFGTGPAGRAYKVSYNRPFRTRASNPSQWLFESEYPMIRWLEANGYDVSYTTGVDSDRRGPELLEHKAFLSVGHDAYWSGAQRANVEAARSAGVGLAFFSAATAFWKTRWEGSIGGGAVPYRTLVCYKETLTNDKIDPIPGVWTGTWRDPRFSPPADGGRPENALTGTLFAVTSADPSTLDVPGEFARFGFWRHTAIALLQPGDVASLPLGTLGPDWDEAPQDAAAPPGLVTLSRTRRSVSSALVDYGSTFGNGNATHSLALVRDPSSRALVFGAGTGRWSWGLDSAHAEADVRMRQATVNLLADMGALPSTPDGDLIVSTESDDTAPVSAIQSPLAGTELQRGSAVTLHGTATDAGGTVARVEISTDGGQSWSLAAGTTNWTFQWTPTATGSVVLRSRAFDAAANVESPGTGVPVSVVAPPGSDCPCSIWNGSTTPAVADAGADWPVELGVRFRSSVAGYITAVRYYKSAANTGTHRGTLWTSTGTKLAAATFVNESASGWQTAVFDVPVPIERDTTYVASYFTSTGHYAFTPNYFAGNGVENGPLRAPALVNGLYEYAGATTFPRWTYRAANYWVDVVFETNPADVTGLSVLRTIPSPGAIADAGATIVATFDEAIGHATLTGATFELRDSANNLVPASVGHEPGSRRVTLTPAAPLDRLRTYTGRLRGGAGGIADLKGNPLAADHTWTFTIGAALSHAPDTGPGGPILVVGSTSDRFSFYNTEILRAEGLNAFAVADVASLTPEVLAGYDLVLLGSVPLTPPQAAVLSTWVNGGGRLVAMRPDKQLAPLFGLADAGGAIGDKYLLIDTASAPGSGLVNQTIQFHGQADLYDVADATIVASLYSSATTPASRPAVTLRSVGGNGGQAAAFTFDLARSVVYTRQGNPAWAGQERDGTSPVRATDMFYSGGTAADWIDMAKVAIPQADEQQRLLANLILQMNASRRPLPRFSYLPRGSKAAVILTGDEHGTGRSAPRLQSFLSASPDGCSVDDWECVRATSYVYPATPMTAEDATGLTDLGFEIGLHVNVGCGDFTPSGLASGFTSQLGQWAARFPSLPSPATIRTHCVPWSDWATHAAVSAANGIRFDTDYYYWPGTWVANQPGLFTGSGMPMRFAAASGEALDVYQAPTQITDESGQSIPPTIAALLDRALGSEAYYGVFTANVHNDSGAMSDAMAIVNAARARGVPIVSARQMLEWLDGRNGSTYRGLSWSDGVLSFAVEPAVGARGLQTMVPLRVNGRPVTGVTADGVPVPFAEETIKGIAYATFPASAASYRVTYERSTSHVTWPAPQAIGYGTALGAAELNAAADAPGTLTFTPGAGTVLPVGTHTLSASFAPADPNGYTSASASVSLTVNPVAAVLTHPENGATNVNMTLPLQWTPIPNVQAYYLYAGTSVGAKDFLDSGETQQTSRVVAVTAGAKVYVRLWTKVGGAWRYCDNSFTAASLPAPSTITSPANGVTVTDATLTVQWTAVPGVQAYYLYLGSAPGAKNYIDTGEITTTSRVVTLPAGQTIHARMWTRVGGTWRYTDSIFNVAAGATSLFSTLTSPSNGSTNVAASLTVQWTAVANAQAYYLYVGSTPGAKDHVDTGELLTTSTAIVLPVAQTVHARLWTKVAGIWRGTDSSFTTAGPGLISTLRSPANGGAGINTAPVVQWTAVQDVQAYYLYIGSSAGAKDYVDTGEMLTTSRLVSLPAGRTVYARMWTKAGGVWRHADSTFSTATNVTPVASTVTSPANGAANVSPSVLVQWTAVANVQAYYLYMGSSAGAKDYVNTGEIQTTSTTVSLPAGRTIYVRMWTKVGDVWRSTDSVFTTQ